MAWSIEINSVSLRIHSPHFSEFHPWIPPSTSSPICLFSFSDLSRSHSLPSPALGSVFSSPLIRERVFLLSPLLTARSLVLPALMYKIAIPFLSTLCSASCYILVCVPLASPFLFVCQFGLLFRLRFLSIDLAPFFSYHFCLIICFKSGSLYTFCLFRFIYSLFDR